MVSIGTVVLKVADVRRAAGFWIKALGYVPRDGQIGENSVVLVPKDGAGPGLALVLSDQMHIDLYVDGKEQQEAEVDRLVSQGAERVEWEYPTDADFVVLSDTEGNLFCVVDTGRS